jgi:YgiT-type zinc finger domain-containing protein
MDTGVVSVATCTHCGGNNVRAAAARSAFWEGDRLVVVEDIPALVCADCGDQFYDDTTAILIDLLRGDGFPEGRARSWLTVPVFSLTDRLAKKDE